MADDQALTGPDIERLVKRYHLERARYEQAAVQVGTRISAALRREARLRFMISTRAKHPQDLKGKLHRKRENPKYTFAALDENLNAIVNDLAGCRVVVYSAEDLQQVTRIIDGLFDIPDLPDTHLDKSQEKEGYRATHRLVALPNDENSSTSGAICEVQICTVAAHLFNELEHDITYKTHGVKPTPEACSLLDDLRWLSLVSDHTASRLIQAQQVARANMEELTSPDTLRFALEGALGRPMSGDFTRLLSLLGSILETVNLSILHSLGGVHQLLKCGRALSHTLSLEHTDDVIYITLGLTEQFGEELVELSSMWSKPELPLRAALLTWASARSTVHESAE
ncbi:MAG: GTP pyrophosphokinase family protein [Bradymonadia bacterium]